MATLTDSETITVTVNEVNVAPVLAAIGNKTVNEESELTFTATATDHDEPAQTLTFSLVGAHRRGQHHGGRRVHLDADRSPGPGRYTFTRRSSRDGALTDTRDDHRHGQRSERGAGAGRHRQPDGQRTDRADLHGDGDRSRRSGPDADLQPGRARPAGPASRRAACSPGRRPRPRGRGVTRSACASRTATLTDSETFTVTVNEVNVAPVLAAIGNQTVNEETELTFTATATDHDHPAQTLTFSLDRRAGRGQHHGGRRVHLDADRGAGTGRVTRSAWSSRMAR